MAERISTRNPIVRYLESTEKWVLKGKSNKAFVHFLPIFCHTYLMIFLVPTLKNYQIQIWQKWGKALFDLPSTHFSMVVLLRAPNTRVFWYPLRRYFPPCTTLNTCDHNHVWVPMRLWRERGWAAELIFLMLFLMIKWKIHDHLHKKILIENIGFYSR